MAGQDMRAATTNFDWLAADSRLVVLGVRDQVARGCQLDEHCPQTRTPDTEVLSRQGAPRLFLALPVSPKRATSWSARPIQRTSTIRSRSIRTSYRLLGRTCKQRMARCPPTRP